MTAAARRRRSPLEALHALQETRRVSLAQLVAEMPEAERRRWYAGLSEEQATELLYLWEFWARPDQKLPRGDWDVWHLEAGRGYGKTRTGAEAVRRWIELGVQRIAFVARTKSDIRLTMVEGDSGILNVFPPGERPRFVESKNRVYFKSGAVAECFSDEVPDSVRGPQFEKTWCDEVSSWPNLRSTWSNLLLATRLRGSSGANRPQHVVTCTPKRRRAYREIFHPSARDLEKIPVEDRLAIVRTHGSSRENLLNLADAFRRVIARYQGTRLGRQEVDGIFTAEAEGALWTEAILDLHRAGTVKLEHLNEIVVAVDPAVTSTERANETGIVVVARGMSDHGYVIGDFSVRAKPSAWAEEIVRVYRAFRANRVVAEVNQGGDLVEAQIRALDPGIPYRAVRASRGKRIRAEPIATLYEQGRIHHARHLDFGDGIEVDPRLEDLEDQMTGWEPDHDRKDDAKKADAEPEGDENAIASPDRVDALVWGLTDLFGEADDWSALTRL